ncbi:hypothetical protein STEG23_016006 [Scotinomys teguina]
MGKEETKKEKPEAFLPPGPSDTYSTYHTTVGTKPGACELAHLLVKIGLDSHIRNGDLECLYYTIASAWKGRVSPPDTGIRFITSFTLHASPTE